MKSRIASNVINHPGLYKKSILLPLFALSAAVTPLSVKAALPARVFAPYIEMNSQSLTSVSQASGIKYFTLAFIIDNGSHQGTWEAGSSVASDTAIAPSIAALRAAGGDVIISFGGAAGNELAVGTTNVANLQAVYQGIINKYGVLALDFDVEGSALDNTAANDRRNQALAGLQAANPGLIISYTLPVDTTGLESDAIALLQNAKSHGVKVACVNIMAMDYSSGNTPNPNAMGQNAIDASNSTIAQLSADGLTTNIGITPLIGTQDAPTSEIFQLVDAQKVEAYALGNSQVNRLTFWEVTSDVSCPNNAVEFDSGTCSGIVQTPWEFSHIFEPFSGGTSTPPPPPPPPGTLTGTSTNGFQSLAISPAQTGTFTATFSATPSVSPENGLVGLSSGAATAYTSIACIARFNPTGDIDAYNGTAYAAASTIPYTAGATYKFTMVVNLSAHTYSVFVTPPGGSQLTVGLNFAFRSTANTATSLNAWDVDENATPAGGVLTANNFTISTGTPPVVATPSFSPGGGTFTSAQTVIISDATSGATIRYTTSGSAPSETNGTVYTGSISIGSTSTLEAIAFESGDTDSNIASSTYTISTGGGGASLTGTSANGFQSRAMSATQTGTFTATFSATPSVSPENGLVGLSSGAATAYAGISCIARFNPSGAIDAYNGTAFAAASTIPYTAGATYQFTMVVNLSAHTYSVFVTPPGGSQLTVGLNFAFRSTAATVTSLNTWDVVENATPANASLAATNLIP